MLERADEGRLVELGIVGEDGDVGVGQDLDLLQCLVGPALDDAVGVGEALGGRQLGAGVGDDDIEAERLGEAGERLRDVDRAEDEERRRRRKGLDEDLDRLVVPGDDDRDAFPTAHAPGDRVRRPGPRRRASRRPGRQASRPAGSGASRRPDRRGRRWRRPTGMRSASACSRRLWISTRDGARPVIP